MVLQIALNQLEHLRIACDAHLQIAVMLRIVLRTLHVFRRHDVPLQLSDAQFEECRPNQFRQQFRSIDAILDRKSTRLNSSHS